MKRLASVCAAALMLSGCLIISNEGGERTVVSDAGSARTDASALYAAAINDPLRPAEERERDPLRHPA